MLNWSLYTSILLIWNSFWQTTFSVYTFCVFWIVICKKEWGISIMQIRKQWLNQLKNFFNKHFEEYYLASFCWWIPSSCESHCNLLYNRTGCVPYVHHDVQCIRQHCYIIVREKYMGKDSRHMYTCTFIKTDRYVD